MAEDYKVHDGKKPEKVEEKKEDKPSSSANENSKIPAKADNKEKKKVEVKKENKKTEAVINGRDLSIGRKHAVAVCNFIEIKILMLL
jgi:hypothetical protein